MNNKKLGLIIPIVAILLVTTILASPQFTYLVYAAGTPDAYGNQISLLTVYQNTTGAYVWKGAVSQANYTAGFQIKVDAGPALRFNVTVKLNYTMAANIGEAVTNTKVNVTIGTGTDYSWNNYTLPTNDGGVDGTTYWNVTWSGIWNNATRPIAGVTYDLTVYYWAYY